MAGRESRDTALGVLGVDSGGSGKREEPSSDKCADDEAVEGDSIGPEFDRCASSVAG